MLITAGEYARLYRYEDCEADVWTLAYKLALEMNDHRIIYSMLSFITIIKRKVYSVDELM